MEVTEWLYILFSSSLALRTPMNTSALRAALARAAVTDRNVDPVRSPLGVLGRRQLTQFDLLGQSLSTMAPATCMVFIALWMSTFHGNAGGLLGRVSYT
ncbi:MAG: hypothetical protein ACJA07_004516 [Rhodococcus sp. (in: high G+C Gram-positive bacteria)]|jgi:hypothetical protein